MNFTLGRILIATLNENIDRPRRSASIFSPTCSGMS